ncbi:MAG: GTP pyrophosphokinase, partial [Granulosicoccus sp.]
FGETVADIVDGVSKLTHMEFSSQEEKQAHNFEKMAIAMSKDIRVIIVKLADRLHNMRTLGPLKPEKRRRIAKETLEMYARIAARLGIQSFRVEFEDRGFEALYPLRARRLRAAVSAVRSKQKELVSHIQETLENQMARWSIESVVTGREKHLYSIYRKMELKGENKRRFRDITDVFGFRIIVDSIDDCYRVLGAVHNLYKPIPGRFKDYIAIPKVNGYQSIHTVVNGAENVPVEVQIRTKEMDEIASTGIAAHWLYKSEGSGDDVSASRARRWINSLLELQQSAGDPVEFIQQVKNDFFSDEIYVFTPQGRIIELPMDATAVDFAYAVHTEIGDTCYACRINNRTASLNQSLSNGQKVHVITDDERRPQANWLNTVKTSKARVAIRQSLKNHQQQDAIDLGRRMLNRMLKQVDANLDNVDESILQKIFDEQKYNNLDDLLSDIGLGNLMSSKVAKLLVPHRADDISTQVQAPLTIDATDGTMITLSRCCHPIPGDAIMGVISAGKGLVIHVDTCKNIADIRDDLDKVSQVSWSEDVQGEFPVDLIINVESDRSLFAQIASRITEMGANIEKIVYKEKDPSRNILRLTIGVKNRVHLADIMRRIRGMRQVDKIGRDKN